MTHSYPRLVNDGNTLYLISYRDGDYYYLDLSTMIECKLFTDIYKSKKSLKVKNGFNINFE